jgi:hypothetical protein
MELSIDRNNDGIKKIRFPSKIRIKTSCPLEMNFKTLIYGVKQDILSSETSVFTSIL